MCVLDVEPTKEEEEMYNLVQNEFSLATSILVALKEYSGVDAALKKVLESIAFSTVALNGG